MPNMPTVLTSADRKQRYEISDTSFAVTGIDAFNPGQAMLNMTVGMGIRVNANGDLSFAGRKQFWPELAQRVVAIANKGIPQDGSRTFTLSGQDQADFNRYMTMVNDALFFPEKPRPDLDPPAPAPPPRPQPVINQIQRDANGRPLTRPARDR